MAQRADFRDQVHTTEYAGCYLPGAWKAKPIQKTYPAPDVGYSGTCIRCGGPNARACGPYSPCHEYSHGQMSVKKALFAIVHNHPVSLKERFRSPRRYRIECEFDTGHAICTRGYCEAEFCLDKEGVVDCRQKFEFTLEECLLVPYPPYHLERIVVMFEIESVEPGSFPGGWIAPGWYFGDPATDEEIGDFEEACAFGIGNK